LDNIVQLAGDKGDHRDPIRSDQALQRPGNRAANQDANMQPRQAERSLERRFLEQRFELFADNASGFDGHDMNEPRSIKNRRNAIVPSGESGSHGCSR
jgi:hypothetical protein